MDIVVWVKFVACAAIIIVAGTKLTRYSDTIADKTGLGKTFVGILFLAVATSIPEMATEISSVRFVTPPNPDLALGDAFGSNLFNLLGAQGRAGAENVGTRVGGQELDDGLENEPIAVIDALARWHQVRAQHRIRHGKAFQ